jgi:hypothetical protein
MMAQLKLYLIHNLRQFFLVAIQKRLDLQKVSTDMVDLMTDEVDKAGTKVFNFGDQVAFGLQLGKIVSN